MVADGFAEGAGAYAAVTAGGRPASGIRIDDSAPVASTGTWLLRRSRLVAVEVGGRSTAWPTGAVVGGGLAALRERSLLCAESTGGGAAGLAPVTAMLLFSVRTAKPENVATNEGVGVKGGLTVKAGALSLRFVGP